MEPLSTHFHNPGAIIPGDKITYEGMLGTDPKSGLAIFDTPENGLKALNKDLAIKFRRGVNTPEKFARAYLGPKADQQEVNNYAIAVADSYGFDATDKEFSQDTLPHLANTVTAVEAGTKRPTMEDLKSPQAPQQDKIPEDNSSGWGGNYPEQTIHDVDFERGQSQFLGGMLGSGVGVSKYLPWQFASKIYKATGKIPTSPEEVAQALQSIYGQKNTASQQADIETKKSTEPLKAGDTWASKIGGPGGDTVTEAADLLRKQRDAPETVKSKFKMGRSGLFEPLDINNPITLPEDKRQQQAADWQKERIEKQTPSLREELIARQNEADKMLKNRPAYVAPKTKAQRAVNMVSNTVKTPLNVGSLVLRSAPVRGGITAASIFGNAADLQNALETGDTTGAALAGTGITGGLASFFPKLNPVAGLVTGGVDTARRIREGDTSGAIVSGGATLAPWAMRAALGAGFGGPAGSVIAMGAPMIYDAARYKAMQRAKEEMEAMESPKDAAAYFSNLAPWER